MPETKRKIAPNTNQQRAIDALEGPVMLLAGPGTGKTFTLIKRVENMISKGIDPSSILCLTFSEAATAEMRTRLINSIGPIAASVTVSTYHGFCNDLIRQNPFEFDLPDNFQLTNEITSRALIKESVDEAGEIEGLVDKWGSKYFYIESILGAINTIKRERTKESEYFEILQNGAEWNMGLSELKNKLIQKQKEGKAAITLQKEIETLNKKILKANEFYKIYQIYKNKMLELGLIDYNDMINFVLDKFEDDPAFKKSVVSQFKYLLVDEYQDTSKVQNQLIFSVLEGANSDNIFVVGDDNQIIYSFQGARTSNLKDFLDRFPKTELIRLTENRRSSQTILDFAYNLMESDNFKLVSNGEKLIAKNEDVIALDKKVSLDIYADTLYENNAIIDKIEQLKNNGVKLSEIAVITRRNDYLETFASLLEGRNIPYEINREKNACEVPSFIAVYFYLKFLQNPFFAQEKLFSLLTLEAFKIKDSDIADVVILSKKYENSCYRAIIENLDTKFKNSNEIINFINTYNELKEKKSYTPLLPYIYEVITKTGLLEYYSNAAYYSFENISAITRLTDEAKSYLLLHKNATTDDFLAHLDEYITQNIKIELPKNPQEADAVKLLTYHGSKGREFEHVFMCDLTSKSFEKAASSNRELKLPILKSCFSQDKNENTDAELRRLLYVGITRAKHSLYLSYSNMKNGTSQVLSKYFASVFPESDSLVDVTAHTEEKDTVSEIKKSLKRVITDENYINELKLRTQSIVLSPTSLNLYLNCPLKYFYSNILKVPVFIENKDILFYGSSIHSMIEYASKYALKAGKYPEITESAEVFKNKLLSYDFSDPKNKEEKLKRGIEQIGKNYNYFINSNPSYIKYLEYSMETEYKGVKLNGKADRIYTDNENKIHICDFKTGSYKKISDNEDYYNQLRFYKFLYETTTGEKNIGSCSLIFFEEGCKVETIEPDTKDNAEIKEKIDFAIENIKNLNFEPSYKKETCANCAYKAVCSLNSR